MEIATPTALWVIALVRMRGEPRTREYFARRTAQGLSKREILRCLKRYIAREVLGIPRSKFPTQVAAQPAQSPA